MTIHNAEVESQAISKQLKTLRLNRTPQTEISSSVNDFNSSDDDDDDEVNNSTNPETTTESESELKNEANEYPDNKKGFNWCAIRDGAGMIVEHGHFQMFIILLILINAIMMGVATFDFVSESESVKQAFEIVDRVFLIIFTVELGLQFCYRGIKLFTDGWLVFDFIIVLMSWSLESLQIVRTFRVFRALRLITRVKVLKNLVGALFSVGPRMFAIVCLLLLVFYIYAVMCTVLFKDLYEQGLTTSDFFGGLDVSLWSLLIIMSLDWAFIARQVMAVYPWSWMVFVSFVMITSFIAYNLIIAVVCDSVSIIEQQGKDEEKEDEIALEVAQYVKIRKLKHRVIKLAKQQKKVLQMLQTITGDEEKLDVDDQSDEDDPAATEEESDR